MNKSEMVRVLFLMLGIVVAPGNADQTVTMTLLGHDVASWTGEFRVHVTQMLLAWELKVTFNHPVSNVHSTDADVKVTNGNHGRYFVLMNKVDHGFHNASDVIRVKVTGSGAVPTATASFVDLTNGPETVPAVPTVPATMQKTAYNYIDVLEKSLLFYEAQRSGALPATNRIPWRADSALGDKGNNNEDLTGGYYDAGDLIKFNFPMAHTVSLLAWGFLQWPEAYSQSGQDAYLRDALKWALDYFLKCHVAEHELYVQVGNPDIDHPIWGRPENMTMKRPAYKITEQQPGSDVAAETAAALAAGYLVFKTVDQTYANTLLAHAKQLFDFAQNFPGKYTESLNINTYGTGDFRDEVFWAASWMYKATSEEKYKTYALAHKTSKPNGGASWEDKTSYADVLLYSLTGDAGLKADILQALHHWLPGGSTPYTPSGFVFAGKWGSLRNAANLVLVALMASENGINVNTTSYTRCWGQRQIEYALGRNPDHRSYVAGFGHNPPTHYHHRPSSCPNMAAPCSFEAFHYPGANPHTLFGGLVGGPGVDDSYADLRGDYVKNEVALDYNAGFTSAIAGLIHMALHNQLPTDCQ